MINVQSINISNDGQLKRVSVMWNELTEYGKTVSTNNRVSRVVTDKDVVKAIGVVEDYVNSVIEEV